MAEKKSLHMVAPLEQLSAFYPLLQRGIWLQVQTGGSVASLLTEQFSIEEKYIVERITTLFLDFKPIDDLETTYVKDGSSLALSSAMPGLVGTTMRRGSHLAAMRGDISCQAQPQGSTGAGRIRIKLFNMIMAELGAILLAHGVCLTHGELGNLLREVGDSFWLNIGSIILDDQQITPANLKEHVRLAAPSGEFLVTVEFKD